MKENPSEIIYNHAVEKISRTPNWGTIKEKKTVKSDCTKQIKTLYFKNITKSNGIWWARKKIFTTHTTDSKELMILTYTHTKLIKTIKRNSKSEQILEIGHANKKIQVIKKQINTI